MELSKTHRAFLVIPSRWLPIIFGLALGLLISAVFNSNFVIRVAPNRISSSSLSRPPSSHPSITTFSNQLFILLFRSSYSHVAAPHQEEIPPSTSMIYKSPSHTNMPYLKHSVSTSHDQSSPQQNNAFQRDPEINKDADEKQNSNHNTSDLQAISPPIDMLDVKGLFAQKTPSNTISLSADTNNQEQQTNDMGHVNDGSLASSNSMHSNGLKTSLADRRNGMGHAHDRFSSSSQSFNDSKSLLADGINGMGLVHNGSSSTNSYCDISIGIWVEDDTYPLYNPGSCPFVDEGFSCQQNGRLDAKYTSWRWAPRDCNVPRFNGTDMLERLRGKRLVFVGDSLNRNQWESMLCMLRESLVDKRRIVQIQGGRISKLPGTYIFKFLDYDCRVEFYTSQYLVDKQERSNQTQYTIRLDRMDRSERRWRKANVLVFNTGHWWTSDKIGEGENCFQEGNKVYRKLEVMVAYSKALSTWARWVDRYVNPQNTRVFFRGYSPVHYIGGQWNSGGQCQDETEPIYESSYLAPYPDKMQALEGVLQEMRVAVHVLNITRLSDYRKDGHPAVYGHPPGLVVPHQDCSHWCLPGIPDTWNELLYFALTKQSP